MPFEHQHLEREERSEMFFKPTHPECERRAPSGSALLVACRPGT
jgi:hypothetical protein